MSITISGHKLTMSQAKTFRTVLDYLHKNAGDSSWKVSSTSSPAGDGHAFSLSTIFSIFSGELLADHSNNAKALESAGVWKASEIEYKYAIFKARPYEQLLTPTERINRNSHKVLDALEDLLKVIAADALIPESMSYMQAARKAVAAARGTK